MNPGAYAQVVRCLGSQAQRLVPSAEAGPQEGYFAIAGTQRLFLGELAAPDAGLTYLCHRIVADPQDLRSHVQRICLLAGRQDGHALPGALVDLFIAAGDKGLDLKQRMLELAVPHLGSTCVAYLKRHLHTGLTPWDESVSRVRGSLLALGISGSHEVVRRLPDAQAAAFDDALEEARSHLEYGQVDAARQVLEQALRGDPDNPLLAAELLAVYAATRDRARRAAMGQYLSGVLGRLPEGWS